MVGEAVVDGEVHQGDRKADAKGDLALGGIGALLGKPGELETVHHLPDEN